MSQGREGSFRDVALGDLCPPNNGFYFFLLSLVDYQRHRDDDLSRYTIRNRRYANTNMGVYPFFATICLPHQTNGSPVSASRTPFTKGGFCSSAQAISNWACVNPRTGTEYEAE